MRSGSRKINQERLNAVDRVRQGWITRLIDLSRRNNLLYYRDLKTGTLNLSNSDPKAISALTSGENVPLARLVPEAELTKVIACIQKIHRRALTNLEEKGLETLFLSMGMATWTPSDSGRPPDAAVILMPIKIETRGTIKLQRNGEAQINPVLLHVLDVEHGCSVTPQDLLQGAESIAEDEPPDLSAVAAYLKQAAREIQGFDVAPRIVLSNFSFQKMAMVRDLRDRLTEMANHDLIAAIAGNVEARQTAGGRGEHLDARLLDHIPPNQEFLVFDADSSQQKVIYEVLSKRNCVIQGPPGTGKSQTIANLITALAAMGLKTLFVAEKRAALEVVMQRLQQKGLGHLLLDFHSADISRRAVMEQFAESLRLVRNAPLVDSSEIHRRFIDRRQRLNDHMNRMHQKRLPAEKSVYELQGELLKFSEGEKTNIRLRDKNLERLTPASADKVETLLQELSSSDLADLFLGNKTSLWMDIKFSSNAAAWRALKQVEQMLEGVYPELDSSLKKFTTKTKFNAPSSIDAIKEQVNLVEAVSDTLSCYSEELFRHNLDQYIKALNPLQHGFFSEKLAWLFDDNFKRAFCTLRGLRKSPANSDRQILEEVTRARDQLRRWRSLAASSSVPCKVPNLDEVRDNLNCLLTELPTLESLLGKQNLSQTQLEEFVNLLITLLLEGNSVQQVLRLRDIKKELDKLGVKSFLAELKRAKPEPTSWRGLFRYTWLASCLDQALSDTPELISFSSLNHERLIQEFRELDLERLKLDVRRVYRKHAEQAVEVMNQHPGQEGLVRREAEKRTRHMPLRKLLAEAPDVLTTLRPCWMASPLSVSQLLDADRQYFDVVIFDEASQVLPEDAVPAILRAQRVVVAGDKHQLPPTTFFAAGADDSEEESESPAEGFESLLDLMSSFLEKRMLEWHYRSRCEELIAFSNRHIYDNRLVTFPNPESTKCISHILVSSASGLDEQEESASKEVQAVVDLVLKHAAEHPEQSLGVITMGVKHANRVQAALDEALRSRSELELFFDDSRSERFFVKNIERVQGDERDIIILSVGYGKDRSGKLPYRFGPLLYEGGERRLNVAITRARQQLTLVSSFDQHDMDPNRSNSRGVELLRQYLQYAASAGAVPYDVGRPIVALNPLEIDVFEALSARGIPLRRQWGASNYRIDMVANHPEQEDRFVLAIECDGASYHALPTVRERDRLRQQQLEALGWRFHRIWAIDWFSKREAEIERAIATYKAAVCSVEQQDVQTERSTRYKQVELALLESVTQQAAEKQIQKRPRPNVPNRDRIDQYEMRELTQLIRWILSDDCLRTDDEIISEMVRELGFKKRGSRIEARIIEAIRRVDKNNL